MSADQLISGYLISVIWVSLIVHLQLKIGTSITTKSQIYYRKTTKTKQMDNCRKQDISLLWKNKPNQPDVKYMQEYFQDIINLEI